MKRLKTTSICLTCFILLALSIQTWGQNQTQRYWLFGNSTRGVRFDQPSNTASTFTRPAVPYGTGGGAVATDATNGTLLFYTDGNNVYDISHAVMPNGGGLQGNASGNAPAIVCPVPGQPNQYYIITNDANYNATTGTIRFSIVDMTQFGNAVFPSPATGDVIQKNQPIPGLTGQSEAMIVIPHTNGTDYWLITQTSGTTDYTVTQISAGGTFTSTTISGLGFSISAGSFSYHAATGQLAVAPQSPNNDVVILNFDSATGALTFNQFVLNSAVASTTNQAIYDVEWSPNGQFLYISRHGEAGVQADVLQYDLNNPGVTLTSVLPQPNSIFQSYGLQIGPDSAIYHLYQATAGGPFLMGKITNTDTVAVAVSYMAQAFPGNIDFNSRQFPSFSPKADVNLSVTFTSQGNCANAPTSFFPTVDPAADSLTWDFGDGAGTSNQWSPVYTYAAGGTYPVTVRAFLNGDSAVFTQDVTITQFDLQITLVQDTTACTCELPFTKTTSPPTPPPNPCPTPFTVTAQIQGGSPTQIEWFGPSGLLAGQTTETLTPDSAGFYYIKVYDASGCFGYAGVNIKEYGVQDQRANIWYFGNMAGIDFNTLPDDPPAAISNPVMNAPEGTAIICDRNGQVILFTDGSTVWDRDFNVIASSIGGDPNSTQSALIVPVPGDETLYYIFTTEAVDGSGGYQLKYSLYDLKVGTSGAVVESDVLLFAKSTERITSNGNWVVVHEWGSNVFRAYQITPTGISNPVISSAGSDHLFSPIANGQGYMKFGGQNLIAVALSNPGTSNVIELFDFTDSSGVVSNPRVLDLNQPGGQVYGIEFSPGGNKVFASVRNGGSSFIVEFAIDSLGNATLLQSVPVPGDIGAMQIGPDGQIYVAVAGSPNLLTFTANEDITQLTPLGALQPFPLVGGTNSTLGLPNFSQNVSTPIQGPAIAVSGFCLGSPTDFSGTGTDIIDEFQWFFGDGAGSTDQTTTHTYAAAGNYTVSLRITNRCGLDTTLIQQITIVPPPDDPNFLPPGMQPVLCTGSLTLEATPATNPDLADLSFLWSTGETTRTITVNQQANYSVTITSIQGCTSSGTILVADNRPIFDLPPNQTICENTPIFPLDALNPGTTYAWTINGVPSGTSQTQSVDTSVPGVFEYEVTVTDPVTTCSVSDSTIYTINQSPVFTATAFPTSACGANDGRIDVNITAPATSLFTYSVVGPSPAVSEIDRTIGLYSTPSTLLPGTYGVTVADQVSGCATITTVGINDNAFMISSVVRQNTCDPLILRVTHTTAITPYDFRVIDASTAQVVVSGTSSGVPFFDTPGVPTGNYIIEMTAGGCTTTFGPQAFSQNPTIPVSFDLSDICDGNLTAVAAGATTFDWQASEAGSLPNPTINNATVALNPGTWDMVVTVDDGPAGDCPGTGSITVTVDNNITPALTQSDACADQVTLTATPAGSFTYRWYRAGVLIPGGQQITTGITDNNVQYRVEIVSALSGCVYSSPAQAIQVIGDLEVTLATTFPCEGSPFTLTATSNQPGASFAWELNGIAIPGTSGPTLDDTREGTYTVTASLSGCTDEADLPILLAPRTPGNLNDKAIICNDPANTDPTTNQIVLDPGSTFISYDWFYQGLSLGVTTQTYTATEPGLYEVNLLNSFGCPSTDQTTIEIECDPKITGPNAFRPNGLNQDFFLYTFFIDDADFQIFIFNRWGEMVFQSDDRTFKWNGSYNNSGGILPPGTYSYVVKYKSSYRPEDGIQEKRGGVVLLR